MGAAKLQLMESRSLLALADPMRMLVSIRWEMFYEELSWISSPQQVSDDIAIVGTLDFFTPIVDEPEAAPDSTDMALAWMGDIEL